MLGMAQEQLDRLVRLLAESKSTEAKRHASATAARAVQRFKATGSAEKRYVNVTGGPRHGQEIGIAALELELAGLGEFLSIVPGPLIRATHSAGTQSTHMPLDPGSTYQSLHKYYDEAYARANVRLADPDLDLQGVEKPLWGHHSGRRGADTVARRTMETTGATEQDIDLVFGWQESLYSQKMQLHYETTFNRERRVRVTMMV
jgi:hypothetical protein